MGKMNPFMDDKKKIYSNTIKLPGYNSKIRGLVLICLEKPKKTSYGMIYAPQEYVIYGKKAH